MAKRERTRVQIDLDELLPGDTVKIGSQDVLIRPLGLLQYKMVVSKMKALIKELSELGVTTENYKDPQQLLIIAETLLTKFPEVLEEVSNIAMEDLEGFPIEVIVSIIDKCLDVNMKAKESLLGNWTSLMGKLEKLGIMEKEKSKA